jgi:hypothetical protein
MNKIININLVILFSFIFVSCSSLSSKRSDNDVNSFGEIVDLEKILNRAEGNATLEGKTILTTGRSIIEKKKVIKGSCWDFANAVYNKAGYAPDQRITPLKSKFKGPYADLSSIQAGDWLYFINYSFKESDHSGIFVEWIDFENKKGVILSYVGGKKKKPGSYKIYDLRHVYYIIRPK